MSQTICLALIDASLLALIFYDTRRRVAPRPYIQVLIAYAVIEAVWISLGRPV